MIRPWSRRTCATSSSSSSWPGAGMIGLPARARTTSKASWMASPVMIGPCADATASTPRASTSSTWRRYAAGSSHWCHGDTRLFIAGMVSSTRSRGRSCTSVHSAGRQAGERVDDPHRRGLRVVQAAGGRAVEDRRLEQVQRAVAGVEAAAGLDPAHALERQRRLLEREPLDAEEVRDERGVGAQLERVEQAAGVVAVVVRQEDPAHVLGLDDARRPSRATARGASGRRCRR